MRITDSIMYSQFLARLQQLNLNYARTNEQVVTGKRINRPSDDPVDSTILASLKTQTSALSQYVNNIDNADRRLESSDARLNDVVLAMTRVIQLNEQGANEPTAGEPRKGIAQEVFTLTQQMLDLADSEVGGRLLFSGTRNTTESLKQITNNPDGSVYSASSLSVTSNGSAGTITGSIPDPRLFNEHIYQVRITGAVNGYEVIDLDSHDRVVASGTFGASPDTISVEGMNLTFSAGALAQGDVFTIVPVYSYNGTDTDMEMQVDANNTVVQNVKGTEPFGGSEPTGATQNPGNTIFDDLVEFRRALLMDDQTALQTSLETVNSQFDNLTEVRANVGGRISNLRNLGERSETELADLLIEVSKIENVNLAEAITELTQNEGARQAALSVGARVGKLNLFNFIG